VKLIGKNVHIFFQREVDLQAVMEKEENLPITGE